MEASFDPLITIAVKAIEYAFERRLHRPRFRAGHMALKKRRDCHSINLPDLLPSPATLWREHGIGASPVLAIAISVEESVRLEPVHEARHIAASDDRGFRQLVHAQSLLRSLLQRP